MRESLWVPRNSLPRHSRNSLPAQTLPPSEILTVTITSLQSFLICDLPSSSCAITYYLALNPIAQSKLQEELDEALGNDDDPIAPSEIVKRLPYLDAVINEALRLHSTSSMGLPRLVPEGGLHVSGKFFPEGTVLSVPSYTIHRDPEIWGNDVEAFRPERWFEQDRVGIQKTFNPFSYGPRLVKPTKHSTGLKEPWLINES